MGDKQKTGLILSGGGARAAYQVGVVQAISSILCDAGWQSSRNPFDIICGTSAGAINATALACRADDFGESVRKLLDVWLHFEVEHVYRADSLGVLRSGARWLSLLSFGWLLRQWRANPPNALLDNTPLASLLHRMLDLPRLDAVLASGTLTLSMLPEELRGKTSLRLIETLIIAPSERLDEIASRHIGSLPRSIRALLGGVGATEARGAALASYLLFQSSYTCELIRLGQRDAFARREDVLTFFGA